MSKLFQMLEKVRPRGRGEGGGGGGGGGDLSPPSFLRRHVLVTADTDLVLR